MSKQEPAKRFRIIMTSRILNVIDDIYTEEDEVLFCCTPDDPSLTEFPGIPAKVIAVHFYPRTKKDWVKYDLELCFVGGVKSRVYMVDTILVLPRGKTLERIEAIRNKGYNENGLRFMIERIKQRNPYKYLGDKSYHAKWNAAITELESLLI